MSKSYFRCDKNTNTNLFLYAYVNYTNSNTAKQHAVL